MYIIKRAFKGIIVTVAAIGIVIGSSAGIASAWTAEASASAACVNGEVIVTVKFTNNDRKAMDLRIIVEKQERHVYNVQPGTSIIPEQFSLATNDTEGGKAYVEATWSNGHGGMEKYRPEWNEATCPGPATTTTSTTTTTVAPTTTTTTPPETTTTVLEEPQLIPPLVIERPEPPAPAPQAPVPAQLAFTGPRTAPAVLGAALLLAGLALVLITRKQTV